MAKRKGREVTVSFQNEAGEEIGKAQFPVYDGLDATVLHKTINTEAFSTDQPDFSKPDAHANIDNNGQKVVVWKRTIFLDDVSSDVQINTELGLNEIPYVNSVPAGMLFTNIVEKIIDGKKAVVVMLSFTLDDNCVLFEPVTGVERSIFTNETKTQLVNIPIQVRVSY